MLILKENDISNIAANAFKELALIEEIDLSSNKLTFESLRPNIFEGNYDPKEYEPLSLLKVLNLGSNRIHSLDSDVFEHLPLLEKLMLDNNPFLVLDHGTTVAISSIPKLKVSIRRNFEELKEKIINISFLVLGLKLHGVENFARAHFTYPTSIDTSKFDRKSDGRNSGCSDLCCKLGVFVAG